MTHRTTAIARFACGMAATVILFSGVVSPPTAVASQHAVQPAERLPEDEVLYLIMPDRFENADRGNDRGRLDGGREVTGYDPVDKAFYHGGDIKGVTARLDYIQGLGATAIWLTPIFRNKPVQTAPFGTSAGYHGYWGLDFTDVDPHLGTKADYKALVDAAHARGMKVYFDIVVNHTADVIKYCDCKDAGCTYRDHANFPYTRRGGVSGTPINQGFGRLTAPELTQANFASLVRPDYAYQPYVPDAEVAAKHPAWMNDPLLYHNRGESTFRGESSGFGDFVGLDDLFTEHPRVLAGMIEIYGRWIDDFGVDGFRIDTARHVNSEFWQTFVPTMLERARKRGIANFHIFGEVMEFEPGQLARYTHVDGLPAVNDFALQSALVEAIAKDGPTDAITEVFRADALYNGGEATARRLVTLTGNHDVMRFARAVRAARPNATNDELMNRVRLAHAVVLLARGVPALYYGDEQGFTGAGDIDQDFREDMFPTKVPSYLAAERLGRKTGHTDNFDRRHPLYRDIAELARLRAREPALRRGAQVSRASGAGPGLLAFSRLAPDGGEILAVFNTSTSPTTDYIQVGPASKRWTSLLGQCAPESQAPGSYRVQVPPLGYVVCKSL